MNVGKEPKKLITTPGKYAIVAGQFFWIVFLTFTLNSTAVFSTVPLYGYGLLLVWVYFNVTIPLTLNNSYMRKSKFVDIDCKKLRYAEAEMEYNWINLIGRTLFICIVIYGCNTQTVY